MTRPSAVRKLPDDTNKPPDWERELGSADQIIGPMGYSEPTPEPEAQEGNDEELAPPNSNPPVEEDDDYGDDYIDEDLGDDEFSDDGFDFSDRGTTNTAAEALRRARQNQRALDDINRTLGTVLERLPVNTQGTASSSTPVGLSFTDDERKLINEAMQKDPASALEVLQNQVIGVATQNAREAAEQNVMRSRAKAEAEQMAARVYPQLKNPTHPFRREVAKRYNEMRSDYESRGIDPDSMPELIRYAAQDVASMNPKLVRERVEDRSDSGEATRQRRADRVTRTSRNRSKSQKGKLPALTETDKALARKLGIDPSDPKVQRSLQARKQYYNDRRRF